MHPTKRSGSPPPSAAAASGIGRGRLVLLALPAALAAAGCNILGPAAYLAGGLPSVDARYELADRPTVVFVDDRVNVIGFNAAAMRVAIASQASQMLMEQEVLVPEHTISPRDTFSIVRAHDRASQRLPIDAIGRLVEAEQVVYVEMLSFRDVSDSGTPEPNAACRVRVIDVSNRTRLFPDPDDQASSETVSATIDHIDPIVLQSPSARYRVHEQLARETGSAIAKLFFRHQERPLGRHLNPR